jgi:xanthine dehydrogenase FAD-binding subunit
MSAVFRPGCLEELFTLLDRYPDARIMAGGTDLLVHLRRFPKACSGPLLLVDRVEELCFVREAEGELSIGAAMSFAGLISHALVSARAPLLASACRTVGGPALRNMATIGGNIVSASPAGDSLPPLYLFDARLELVSRRGVRRIPLADFICGEILSRVCVPFQDGDALTGFEKIGLRKSLAIAVASFCGFLKMSADRTVTQARFAWGSVAPTVVRFFDLEAALPGRKLDSALIRELAGDVKIRVSPIDDIRATAEYRRLVAANMLVRFLGVDHV